MRREPGDENATRQLCGSIQKIVAVGRSRVAPTSRKLRSMRPGKTGSEWSEYQAQDD